MIPPLCVAILAIAIASIGECRDLSYDTGGPEETERKEVCIEVLGCFPETDPNNKPTDNIDKFFAWVSETIDTQFWMSTREKVGTEFRFWAPGSTHPEVMNNFNFHNHITKKSKYDVTLKTFFIIHGYQGGNALWAVAMKDALMEKHPCNVFIVDWTEGSGILYGTARLNTWVVGAETGRFIERIVGLKGMKAGKVHIIGHSLGAHTAGFAGKWVKNRVKKTLGRITGLDPAGVDFGDVVPGERLDRDDAVLVDVIHTNAAESGLEGLGLKKAIGHFDFYPNGGENQPGCPMFVDAEKSIGKEIFEYINPTYKLYVTIAGDDKSISDAFNDLACSHGRAYEYFIESIKTDDSHFWADECTSWEDYVAYKCLMSKYISLNMGINAKRFRQDIDRNRSRTFYLRTTATPPYYNEKY